jgi:ABC-2 type transport system permease protein
MTTAGLARSETSKLHTARSTWVLAIVAILGTWSMAWANALTGSGIASDDPRLFSAEPVPLQFQGFEMAGFGYVLVVALASIYAGSEYGPGRQIQTTLLATPNPLPVFLTKATLLTGAVTLIGFLTMTGAIFITHAAGNTGVRPWVLTPAIWANVGGVTLAFSLSALVAFGVGVLARSAIAPLLLITPLVIGLGDFLAGFWNGARYLPVVAGSALYGDPLRGDLLSPAAGGLVQVAWALLVLVVSAVAFVRRDL